MRAMIPGSEFELRKAQAPAPLAAIPVAIIRAAVIREVPEVGIPVGAIRAVGIREVREAAIPEEVAGEAIPQGADPTAKTRILKTTPKCSR